MKLSVWAELQGVSYKTARRMWKAGTLPVPSEPLATGTVIVHAGAPAAGVALYARVSGNDQKTDLDRQVLRLTDHAIANRIAVVDVVREVGSGLNGQRKCLVRLLRNPQVRTIMVEHRDRLVRFGFEYLEAALASCDRRLIVVDADEVADDPVRDTTEVMTSLCARLYGKRSAANRAKKAIQAIQAQDDHPAALHEAD